MIKCYASALGDCDIIQSHEHAISKTLFPGGIVEVSGLPVFNGQKKTLPIKTLGSNILCKKHNEGLSKLDTEAKKLFNFTNESIELANRRESSKLRERLFVKKYYIDGNLFERWLFKAVLGICCQFRDTVLHDTNKAAIESPIELIQGIYGKENFKIPLGMYSIFENQTFEASQDVFSISFLLHPDSKGVVGAEVKFKSIWRFLCWLSKEPPEPFEFENGDGNIIRVDQSSYHFEVLKFSARFLISSKIYFVW